MATTAATPRKSSHWIRRSFGWTLVVLAALVVAVMIFAALRPLTLLVYAAQGRLLLAGVHSDTTKISYAGLENIHVHYYEGGSGSPVVLVHGLGGRAEDWASLMPRLVRDHHRVYALDLPGYGRSDWPRDAKYSIAEEAAAVEAFMQNRRLTQVDLGGWSMGGWVAMRVALDQPQSIRRLMIFDSAGIRFQLNWDVSLFEPNTPAKLRALDDLLMPTPPPQVPGFIARSIFRYVDLHGWVVKRNMESMLTGADLLDGKLGALRMPMLIVWGKQDHVIPYMAGEQIHKDVPQSELEIFDGCGHLAPSQCGAQIGPVVEGFLDERSPIPGVEAEIRTRH